MTSGAPGPGRRVWATVPGFAIPFALYLPSDYDPSRGRRYPLVVEYAGNGPFQDSIGDRCTGEVNGTHLGFGMAPRPGREVIWAALPYLNAYANCSQTYWWGCAQCTPAPKTAALCGAPDYDVEPTVRYAKAAVRFILDTFHGNASAVLLTGFSRGAIACNYIGLHDEEIAALWTAGFVPYAHYDGVQEWIYPQSDRASALARLQRLGLRKSFVVGECDLATRVERDYILGAGLPSVAGFSFVSTGLRNHNDQWVCRDLPARRQLRAFVAAAFNLAPEAP